MITLLQLYFFLISLATAKPLWPDISTPLRNALSPDHQHDSALIVAIEDYFILPPIPGAVQNAQDWQGYLVNGLGLAPGNVKVLTNAEASKRTSKRTNTQTNEPACKRARKQIIKHSL